MKVLILGPNSQLAQALVSFQAELLNNDIDIVVPESRIPFGTEIPANILDGVDFVLNFCFSYSGHIEDDKRRNIPGTLMWVKQVTKSSKRQFIQISSDSIRFNPESAYSKVKSQVDEEILRYEQTRIFKIPTLIGVNAPKPSQTLFRILDFQYEIMNRVYVPKGFSSKKILKYLQVEDFWHQLSAFLASNKRSETASSQNPEECYALTDIWKKHRSSVGKVTEAISVTEFVDMRRVFTIYKFYLNFGFPGIKAMEALRFLSIQDRATM